MAYKSKLGFRIKSEKLPNILVSRGYRPQYTLIITQKKMCGRVE